MEEIKEAQKLKAPPGAILIRPQDTTPPGIVVVGDSSKYKIGTVLDVGEDLAGWTGDLAPGDEVYFESGDASQFLPDVWHLAAANVLAYSKFIHEYE